MFTILKDLVIFYINYEIIWEVILTRIRKRYNSDTLKDGGCYSYFEDVANVILVASRIPSEYWAFSNQC